MSLSPEKIEQAHELLWALRSGQASAEQLQRLEQMVCEEPDVRTLYVRYMHLCADLFWNSKSREAVEDESAEETATSFPSFFCPGLERLSPLDDPPQTGDAPVVVLDLATSVAESSRRFSPGVLFFSYAVAIAVLLGGLAAGWIWQISPSQEFVRDLAGYPPRQSNDGQRAHIVGRVTGMLDCEWSDTATSASEGTRIPLGRRIALSSGLLELTYESGAKILLQGPCQYQVDASDGGYLARGRLTAVVETKCNAEGSDLDAASDVRREGGSFASRPTVTQAFVIRTPTAVVTDLGTEFGVEVDENGSSRAHVFRGRAEVRCRDDVSGSTRTDLNENESVRIELAKNSRVQVSREPLSLAQFTRQMPKWRPIPLHNTGFGLKEGNRDPHWQFVARSDQPRFDPQPAVVAKVDSRYRLPNDPGRSQWISFDGLLPNDVVFTARTTFEMTGLSTKKAVLWGRYLVDDHIRAIRLNGRSVEWQPDREEGVFYRYRVFKITKGFVDGVNTLELDILNGDYSAAQPGSQSYMALRVELDGSALEEWNRGPVETTP